MARPDAYNANIINNIIYGFGDDPVDGGIIIQRVETVGPTINIMNNTVVKCYNNIAQGESDVISYTLVIKNNLCQGDTGGSDFVDAGGGLGTTAYNVSEDGSSPDIAYRSMNLHDANSCFRDYDNDDYRLLRTGDEIGDLP